MNGEKYLGVDREVNITHDLININLKSNDPNENIEYLTARALSVFMIIDNDQLKSKYVEYVKSHNKEWTEK